ncbi:MAG: GNAT family N-acetyltransferase, partial [Pusillimonas sp.]|nr:GNAT family N-acetyltransferase [Pusillimonas sp.]
MLELVRVNATVDTAAVWPKSPVEGLVMGLARTNEELEAIQRLRYKVFTEEMNAVFPDAI